MRHRVYGYKLGRDTEHRKAMFRNLVAGLFEHGQITTTKHKAKAVQPFAEKLITLAKRGDLHARRRAIALLRDRIMCDDPEKVTRDRRGEVKSGPKLIRHLFEQIGPRYEHRKGGYTRIIKLASYRIGDATDLVMLQLVGDESGPEIGGFKSHRRDAANRRRDFAKKLGVASARDDAGETTPTATATAVVPAADESDMASDEAPTADDADDCEVSGEPTAPDEDDG